jgi:Sulfotransferase family
VRNPRGHSSVLLAGTPRCGSTWLANVLGRANATRTVYEPDGPISDVLGAMAATRLGPFPVLRADEPSGWYRLVWDLAFSGGWPWDQVEGARAVGRRLVRVPPSVRDAAIAGLAVGTSRLRRRPDNVVVKSVNSAFSLEWIAQRYAPKMVVLHRNPLNVVSSWLVLDMVNQWPVGQDPWVRANYLEPLGLTAPAPDSSNVALVAWNVGLLMLALKRTVERHPDWVEVSYDELSADPIPGCKSLFARLGLDWTDAAEDFLEKADDPKFVVHGGNPRAHPNAITATDGTSRRAQQASQFRRRLSDDDISEAHAILEAFDLGEWGPPSI